MSKKVIRQVKALERFNIRAQGTEETKENYAAYLARKEQERVKLINVKSRYHASI